MRARTLTGSLGLSGPSQPIYLARHVRNVPRHHSLQRAIKQQPGLFMSQRDRKTALKGKERKNRDNPREGWEDGTPPPHGDLRRGV